MTRPAEYVDWDILDTHSTRPADPLKDGGYATNDIPTSAELNWVLQQLSAWTAYLDDQLFANVRTRSIPLNLFSTGGVWASTAFGYIGSSGAASPGGQILIPFDVGDIISGIGFIGRGGVGPLTITNSVFVVTTVAATSPPILTPILSADVFTDSAGSPVGSNWVAYEKTFAPHTMAAGEGLMWQFDPSGSGMRIANAFVLVSRAP